MGILGKTSIWSCHFLIFKDLKCLIYLLNALVTFYILFSTCQFLKQQKWFLLWTYYMSMICVDLIILNSRWQCVISNAQPHTHWWDVPLYLFLMLWFLQGLNFCFIQRDVMCMCVWEYKNNMRSQSRSPLTLWCVSWTAAWSRSNPSLCQWSRPGALRGSGRPLGLLSAAVRPCGSRPPPRSPLLPRPGWCSEETAPTTVNTCHTNVFYKSDDKKTNSRRWNKLLKAACKFLSDTISV